jgi:hypothetical protein
VIAIFADGDGCLEAGGRVLDTNARVFDEDSIGRLVATRDLEAYLRESIGQRPLAQTIRSGTRNPWIRRCDSVRERTRLPTNDRSVCAGDIPPPVEAELTRCAGRRSLKPSSFAVPSCPVSFLADGDVLFLELDRRIQLT